MTADTALTPARKPRLLGVWGRRLLLWFLLISLLPLVVSNGLGYARSEVIIDGLVQRFLTSIAELQAGHVSERLESLARALELLAEEPIVRAAARAGTYSPEVTEALARSMEAHPEFDALYLFTEGGRIRVSHPLSPEDLPFWIGPPLEAPHPRFEVRRDTQPPHYPFVRLLAPVPAGDGTNERHYVGASVSLSGGQTLLDLPEHTAGSVETIVVDESGLPVFVSHPHGHVDFGIRFESPLLDAPAGSFAAYADRLGVPVLGTTVTVPEYSWTLVNEVPVIDALSELRELRRLSIWLALGLTVLVLGGAWFVSGRIVAPVGRLLAATRSLGSGELSSRVEPVGRDEITELSRAFNEMAETLQETTAQVEELHHREMERAAQLATVGELAAGIAHEIKNPVAGIAGGMDLISKRAGEDPELAKIIEEMKRQTTRIGRAVRDLLAFARPAEPQLARVGLNAAVERAAILVGAEAERLGVSVELELEPDLPAARADEEQLNQCLVNLMVNAVQAAGEKGWVRVVTGAVAADVEVRIVDSGPGIPEGQIDQIFKPFFTTKHRGTGLGLPITADLIAKQGGTLSVESGNSEGATFVVRLPAQDAR